MLTKNQPGSDTSSRMTALRHFSLSSSLALALAIGLDMAGAGTLLALGAAQHDHATSMIHGSASVAAEAPFVHDYDAR